MTNEDYCSYQTSQALKKAGFDWPCYEYWDVHFCTDGTPIKTRHVHGDHKFRVCVMSERNSVLEDMGSDLITAPTLAQAQKWLITKGIFVEVGCFGKFDSNKYFCKDIIYWSYELVNTITGDDIGDNEDVFEGYEAALSAGIEAALKLIEEGEG